MFITYFRQSIQLASAGFLLILVAGCGPVHPRWRNAGQSPITVTYVRGADRIALSLAPGKEGAPMAFFDFQQVERIDIQDKGQMLRLKGNDVARLHDQCGHGYRCRINYYGDGHLDVSTR